MYHLKNQIGGEVLGMVIGDVILGPIGIRTDGVYMNSPLLNASAPGLYQILGFRCGAGRTEFRAVLLLQSHGETALKAGIDILHFASSFENSFCAHPLIRQGRRVVYCIINFA